MRNTFKKLGALVITFGLACSPSEAKTDTENLPKIPAALSGVKYVTETEPKLDAKVYFLFQSHSKCGFCVKHTPEIIAQYKRMRGKGAEIVLLNCDMNDEAALKWAESAGMTYPVVSPTERRKVPFNFDFTAGPPPPLPLMTAVTADGEPLGQAGGPGVDDLLKDWRKLVNEAKKLERTRKAEEKKAAAADDEDADDEEAEPRKKSKKSKKKKKSKKSKRSDD